MAFKIADAYVDIHGKLDKNNFKKVAQQMLTFLPIVGSLSTLAVGAASALFSLASSLSFSTLALSAAIPAAFGLGGALGVLMLIFKDMDKTAMKPIQDSLKKIQTDMQKVAISFAKPGIESFMKAIQKAMPIALTYVRNLAFGIGHLFYELGRLSQTELFRGRLKTLLEGTAKSMGYLFEAGDAVVDIIVTIGAAAVPVFQRFTHWLGLTLGQWQRWISMKEGTGELARLFSEAATELSKWAQIAYNFLSGVVGLMSAGRTEGSRLTDSLLGISEAFKSWAWNPETQGKIKELLETINNIDYEEIIKVASAITTIGLAMRALSLGSTVVEGLMAFINLGPVAIVVGALAFGLALLAGVLVLAYMASEEFRRVVDQGWTWINENVLPILKDFYHWFKEKLMVAIDDAVKENLPKFEEEWRKLEKAWNENKDQLIPFVDKLRELAGFIIVEGIPAVMALIAQLAGGLVNAIALAMFWLNGLNRALDTIGSVIESIEVGFDDLKSDLHDLASAIGREVDRINSFLRMINVPSIPNPFSGWGRAHGGVVGAFAHGGVRGAASGGARSGFTLVGEAGPELVRLGAGSRVRSNPDTRRMLAGAGGMAPIINLYVQGSIRSDIDLKRMLRDEITAMGF